MLEKLVLRLLRQRGFVLQRTVSRQFGIDRTTTAKLVRRLVSRWLVEREKTWYKGRVTFKLFRLPVRSQSLKMLVDIPCFGCREIDRCGVGSRNLSPVNCGKMDGWLWREALKFKKEGKASLNEVTRLASVS